MQRCWRKIYFAVAIISMLAMILVPASLGAIPPAANRAIDFNNDIKPILQNNCGQCHGNGRAKGDFRIDTRETMLKGGEDGPGAGREK